MAAALAGSTPRTMSFVTPVVLGWAAQLALPATHMRLATSDASTYKKGDTTRTAYDLLGLQTYFTAENSHTEPPFRQSLPAVARTRTLAHRQANEAYPAARRSIRFRFNFNS